MNNEFIIRIKTGYDENYFAKKETKLDIISNSDTLSYYPVEIELRKIISNEDSDLVAKINGFYFDLDYMLDEEVNLFSIFDSIDQNTHELYSILFKENYYKEDYEVLNPNLFNLYNIIIEEDYNNIEYFKLIINSLGDILRYVAKLNVGVISSRISNFELKENLRKIFLANDYISLKENKDYLLKIYH